MSTTTPYRTGRRRLAPGVLPRIVITAVAVTIVVAAASFVVWLARMPDRVSSEGRSYGLSSADVTYQLRPDGSADVVERITFDFAGSFRGAFRDIPLRAGDTVDEVVVCDAVGGSPGPFSDVPVPDVSQLAPAQARMVLDAYESAFPQLGRDAAAGTRCPAGLAAYTPGASTVLGSAGMPGSFGTEVIPAPSDDDDEARVLRIVWHYDASDGPREFTIAYRATGLVRRSGDGADAPLVVSATPWGREWQAALGSLTSVVRLPRTATAVASDIDAWVAARGAATTSSTVQEGSKLRPPSIVARAANVTSGEQVDLLARLPAAGSGIQATKLSESPDAAATMRTRGAAGVRDNAKRAQQLAVLTSRPAAFWPALAALLGLVVAGACALIAWRRDLREEPWPESVPRFVTDPPSELAPALAVSLVEQRADAAPTALVATVFDLVRRGAYTTMPAQGTQRGAQVDIALQKADRTGQQFSENETSVLQLVDTIVGDSSVAMGEFRDRLKYDLAMSRRASMEQHGFESRVKRDIALRNWYTHPRSFWLRWPSRLALLLFVASITLVAWTDLAWRIGSDPRTTTIIGAIGATLSLTMLVVLIVVISSRLVRTRYRSEAREEAAQWFAYRAYLDSYGDMGDEQTASIEIWERHLVYAIAFGCAEDILSAVRPGTTSSVGADPRDSSSLATMPIATFHTFSSGITARAPQPSTSSSGGSGGSSFSGGGGGGFGGGGGGAW